MNSTTRPLFSCSPASRRASARRADAYFIVVHRERATERRVRPTVRIPSRETTGALTSQPARASRITGHVILAARVVDLATTIALDEHVVRRADTDRFAKRHTTRARVAITWAVVEGAARLHAGPSPELRVQVDADRSGRAPEEAIGLLVAGIAELLVRIRWRADAITRQANPRRRMVSLP